MCHAENIFRVNLPAEDEYLAYSKHVEDVIGIKLKKVHFFGFIIQFIMLHGQYNIKKACKFLCMCRSASVYVRAGLQVLAHVQACKRLCTCRSSSVGACAGLQGFM